MSNYEDKVRRELTIWQHQMLLKPSLTGRFTKGIQNKVNNLVPEKVHQVMTKSIKTMVKAVLTGSEYITGKPIFEGVSLEQREKLVAESINLYRKTALLEGAGTGAGGILLGLADFPLLLSIKIKFLFEVARTYGYDVKDYRERLFILHVFQLAFSSEIKRREVYQKILNWQTTVKELPNTLEGLNWQAFQQEYRDYIDLAKLMQLVPVIGAFVGAYANYKLLNKLGETAKNSYRLRLLKNL